MELLTDLTLGRYFTFKEADKLPIHRWFHYKEGFSPQLVHKLIDEGFGGPLLDPFMGSGTTLLAADEKCIESYGIDVSPLSVFVAETKVRKYGRDVLKELESFAKALKTFKDEAKWTFELFPPQRAFPPRNYHAILKIREAIEHLEYPVKSLALLALISIIPRTSFVVKDGGVLRIMKHKRVGDAYDIYRRTAKKIIHDTQKFKHCIEGKAEFGDARRMPIEDETISSIITSPPYLNNVDYSKVYGMELSLLTLNKRATVETRKHLLPSFIGVKGSFGEYKEMAANSYFKASEEVWKEFHRVLKEGGKVAYNVSNAVIHGEHIAVDEKIAEIAENLGFKNVKIIVGLIRKTRINRRIYKVRESLITAEK